VKSIFDLFISRLTLQIADLITAAKQAADERQRPADDYVITLSRSLAVPFLTYSTRRDLREKVFTTWCRRGELNAARDNRKMAVQILDLRAQQAQMHGYESYAAYAVADTMASRPDAVAQLLERVWTPATASANNEREQLQAFAASAQAGEEGLKDSLQAWDWRFYAERLRQARYDFDEATLKPYLSLERITEAAFDCANRLYGLRYVPRPDIQGYHPDVKVYEVRETTEAGVDRLVAVFLADNFARPHKRGGAWMSDLRSQSRNSTDASGKLDITDGDRIVPIILNNNNFCKAPPGQPTLLSFDDGVTLFHEFGHSLHGVLSDAKYNRLAGTNVLSDFVELPSQLMEHWFSAPRVMRQHARHFETDEPISEEMLQRLKAARCFNQGFQVCVFVCECVVTLDSFIHWITFQLFTDRRVHCVCLVGSAFTRVDASRIGEP
jgi:peptidyl-dipeptidase Dcp